MRPFRTRSPGAPRRQPTEPPAGAPLPTKRCARAPHRISAPLLRSREEGIAGGQRTRGDAAAVIGGGGGGGGADPRRPRRGGVVATAAVVAARGEEERRVELLHL